MGNFTDDFVSYDGEDTFLKIKTATRGLIKGESRDAQHPEELGVYDWSWGMEARSGLSGAGGSSKATLKPLHIVIRAGRASTALMSTLRNNELIKEMVLSVRKVGRPHAYFKLIIKNARITFLKVRTVIWNGQPALVVYLSFSVQDFRVDFWRPEAAVVRSDSFGDPVDFPDRDLDLDNANWNIGWLTYLENRKVATVLPPEIEHEFLDAGGVLITTTREAISATNPEHVATALLIRDTLYAKGLLQHKGYDASSSVHV